MKEKILIVYYSQSGNTAKIAELIQRKTQGTLCEIVPEELYPSLYIGGAERVKQERKEGIYPAIKTRIKDINNYDIIFIGTPNWGNCIAHPIMTFLNIHDIEGKTIIPFCTHCGSGLGNVAEDIKKRCRNSRILKSFEIYGNGGTEAEAKVEAWLNSLESM